MSLGKDKAQTIHVRSYVRSLLLKNKWPYRLQKFIRACAYSTPWMPHIRGIIHWRWLYLVVFALSVPFGLINYLFSPSADKLPPQGLAVVAIAKNESRYIEEWIQYYLQSGVDKIILYDNGSTDDTAEIVKKYAGGGLDYIYFPGSVRQLDAYNVALHRYRNQYRYMMFLDCDEFIYSDGDLRTDIDILFRQRDDTGGLSVFQLLYGDSGHKERPEGRVLEEYLWRAKDESPVNCQIKTISIPIRTFAYVYPHYPILRHGYRRYDEKGRQMVILGDYNFTAEHIRINHYMTKSQEDWAEKVSRGKADLNEKRDMEELDYWNQNDVYDDRLLRKIRQDNVNIAKTNESDR